MTSIMVPLSVKIIQVRHSNINAKDGLEDGAKVLEEHLDAGYRIHCAVATAPGNSSYDPSRIFYTLIRDSYLQNVTP